MSKLDQKSSQKSSMLDRLTSREALVAVLTGLGVLSAATYYPAKLNQERTCETMQNGGDLDDPQYYPLYYPHQENGEWKFKKEGGPTVSYGDGPAGTFLTEPLASASQIDPADHQAIADACTKGDIKVTAEQVREALLTLDK